MSSDLKHYAELTKAFQHRAFQLLNEETTLQEVKRVVEFTDWCASQCKCKYAFDDLSKCTWDVQRNYFETSHDKSPCDGLGSVVQNTCLRTVVTGKAILCDAGAVMKFCSEKLGHGLKQKGENELSRWGSFMLPIYSVKNRNS